MTPARRTLAAAALVVAAGLAAHGLVVANGFAWDDEYLVLENPAIRDLSEAGSLFVEPWAAGVDYALGAAQNRPYYRPLALASMAVDWAIGGADPRVFHATSLALHLAAALFLFAWARGRLFAATGDDRRADLWAAAAAVLWAVHPVHTEAIDVVSYRTTVLSGLGVFATLWAFSGRPSWPRTAAGCAALALGLLAKETTLVAPGLVVLQDLFLDLPARPGSRRRPVVDRLLAAWLPMAAVAIAWLVLRAAMVSGGVYASYFEGLDAGGKALMAGRVFFNYVRLAVLPWPLCPFYDWSILGAPRSLLEPDVLAGALLLAALPAAAVLLRRRAPLAAFGLAFFLVALLPVSHLVPFFDATGDRFLYVPLAGLALALAAAGAAASRARAIAAAAVAAAVGFAGLAAYRTTEWRDSETILRATVRDFPASVSAGLGLGRLLLAQDRPREALEPLAAVVRLAPRLPVGHGLLAVAQARAGDLAASRDTLRRAPLPEPGLPSAAQVARGEFLRRGELDVLHRMGL